MLPDKSVLPEPGYFSTYKKDATVSTGRMVVRAKELPSVFEIRRCSLGEGELIYVPHYVPDPDLRLQESQDIKFSPEHIKIYGRDLVLERQTANYGIPYDYNPNAKRPYEWEEGTVLELRKKLEIDTGMNIVQCACNLYPTGDTIISLHQDKRHPKYIASISLGSVRKMAWARKGDPVYKNEKYDPSLPILELEPGSLVLFSNAVNEEFKHMITRDASVTIPRVSITFREF
jgi:alkylated DNA repair dioxygenase AlkB